MPKSPLPYRIEVIPITPLFGRKDPHFSYAFSDPIKVGSLVSIPFGKRTLTGVVTGASRFVTPVPHWIKYIEHVLLPSFLREDQLTLALAISHDCYTPLGLVLKHFLPVTKEPKQKITKELLPSVKKKAVIPRSLAESKRLVPLLSKKQPVSEVRDNDLALEKDVLGLTKAVLKKKKQVLILLPEILAAELWAAHMKELFPESETILLTSTGTPRETYLSYERIRLGKPAIIIGTRQALFAPYNNLGALLMLHPESRISYMQWEMAPRYDTETVGKSLAKLHQAAFITLSIAPGLDFFLEKKKKSTKKLPLLPPNSFQAIDLRKTYKKGKQEVLSKDLRDSLRELFRKKEKALLLVRQRGLSRFSLCDQCQTLMRCPKCQNPLSETGKGIYRCLACGHTSSLFPACSACGHMHFRNFGAGTETVAKSMYDHFPEAKVLVVDRDTLTAKKKLVATKKALLTNDYDVLITTYEIGRNLPLSPAHLIAMIEPDEGLFLSDYRAEEELFVTVRRFGGKLSSQGRLIAQTFKPDSRPWSIWPKESAPVIAEELLEDRKSLHYPPYYQFLLIECLGNVRESSHDQAKKIETALRNLQGKNIEIIPPFLPFSRKKKFYRLLIRYPHTLSLPLSFDSYLRSLDQTVRITVEPHSLHH